MSAPLALIVGLGNPGPEYADTRHNAGFRFLEVVARAYGTVLRHESRFNAQVGRLRVGDVELWLAAPQTFMNRSGDAVARIAAYYKIAPTDMLVVHDELDLPVGVVRLKSGGGAGGHNGLSDIIQKIGSNAFARLRIGIGRPVRSSEVADYVLHRASAAEQQAIDAAIDQARALLPEMVAGDLPRAMQRLHTKTEVS